MTVHAERQFTGELDLFTNRAILVGGRIGADGRVARLGRAQFSAGCWPPSRTSRMW
jgi:thioredoxin reductase (NADPH)